MNIEEKASNNAGSAVAGRLMSGNEGTVLEAISELWDNGSPVIIPNLITLLMETTYPSVKKKVFMLLGDLKDPGCIPYMINAIEDPRYAAIHKDLIAACWQNSLDFSGYLAHFVDWVINRENDIAFEAFTVIESMERYPSPDIRQAEIARINRALQNCGDIKKYLLSELRGILA